jgi:MFS family permease
MGGFLGKLNAHGTELGLVVSAGLAGAAVSAVLATFAADRLGRVRFLVAVSILGMAGLLMTGDAMFLPLVIGAAMKIGYDILLWRASRGTKPPEERV